MRFSQDQKDLASMTAEVFSDFDTVDLDRVDALDVDHAGLREQWKAIAGQGVIGALVPEASDGSGLDDQDVSLVLENIGYAGIAEPVMETLSVAVPLLRDAGQAEYRTVLAGIASGDLIATVCSGSGSVAPWGADADLLLMPAEDGLHLLPRGAWQATRVPGVDASRRLAIVDAELSAETLVTLPSAVEMMRWRLAAGSAAVLNGVSRRLLDMSVEYAQQRVQFGQPIGTFQAVKHLLADVAVATETARSAAWHAALSLAERGSDIERSAWVAKSAANSAAELASTNALQVHGGIGFTWEHSLHVWMKRALALSQSYGTTQQCHLRLGEAVLRSSDIVTDFSILHPSTRTN